MDTEEVGASRGQAEGQVKPDLEPNEEGALGRGSWPLSENGVRSLVGCRGE